jgi:hypothetical protein
VVPVEGDVVTGAAADREHVAVVAQLDEDLAIVHVTVDEERGSAPFGLQAFAKLDGRSGMRCERASHDDDARRRRTTRHALFPRPCVGDPMRQARSGTARSYGPT